MLVRQQEIDGQRCPLDLPHSAIGTERISMAKGKKLIMATTEIVADLLGSVYRKEKDVLITVVHISVKEPKTLEKIIQKGILVLLVI